MEKAFKSARLTFHAFEDDVDQKSFFHKSIQSDPTNFAQSDISLFRPQSIKASNETFSQIAKAPLAVMIYLTQEAKEDQSDGNNREEEKNDKKGEGKEIPIGFLCLSTNPLASYTHHRTCTLGLSIAAPYQGKGYGSEAMNWAIDWAFRNGNFHSVGLLCLSFNTGAERLYERLGFVREGVLRERLWFDGRWHDEIMFGMVRGDWERLRSLGQ